MNKNILFALISVLALSVTAFTAFQLNSSNLRGDDNVTLFKQFQKTYNKRYADLTIESYRLSVFTQNLKMIKKDSTFGITQFMDMTTSEFAEQYLTLREKPTATTKFVAQETSSTEVDWVAQGKVTPVKNQGQCGSCWAFSAIGSIESAFLIAGQGEVNLAEQELVDCAINPEYDADGCDGGWMVEGFKYIVQNKISKTTNYPYKAVDGKCKDTSSFQKYSISNYAEIDREDCNSLNAALQLGPVSVALDASNFQFYHSGVFDNCDYRLNHAVLLVANTNSTLTIKNSWGTNWGERGYIRLAPGNTCGICNAASFPIL